MGDSLKILSVNLYYKQIKSTLNQLEFWALAYVCERKKEGENEREREGRSKDIVLLTLGLESIAPRTESKLFPLLVGAGS